MSIVELTYRLVTDRTFQSRLLADPQATLESAGLDVTTSELETLASLPWSHLLSQRQAQVFEPNINGWWGSQFTHCSSV